MRLYKFQLNPSFQLLHWAAGAPKRDSSLRRNVALLTLPFKACKQPRQATKAVHEILLPFPAIVTRFRRTRDWDVSQSSFSPLGVKHRMHRI